MSNWLLPSETTLFKRKLLRRMKWIGMVRPAAAVRTIYLDHEGLPRQEGMPREKEDFLPINTTIGELEAWGVILDGLDKFLTEPGNARDNRRLAHRLFGIFSWIMLARRQCKKELHVLAEFSSGPEITGTILDQMDLVTILNRVALEEHLNASTTPEITIGPAAMSFIRNVLKKQQNEHLLRMVDDVIWEIEVELLTTPNCPATQYTRIV
ncbi:hypothetical protein FPSE_06890 [Fusarium pseudograminearum CS3096]|uniref:Uncharacterized protein n=1 Tax=Fusarium pseudograminearum (strain CS3096) TaxID=1028729 RepID=K3VFU4_FUSPC|nr:hypothetical protein FPSE_06890 [Fusarium pseudograminearum CS3096]EKJ72844.1 hypothetical protein FPSE_06890 [Fusarium pseudograminearum CS3096]